MGKFVKIEGVTVKRIHALEERKSGDNTYPSLKIDVEAPLGQYEKKPQVYRLEATYDKTIRETRELSVGQVANIGVNLCGIEYVKKETGATEVFNKMEIATIEIVSGAKSNDGSAGLDSAKPPLTEPELEEKDDLPF